MKTFMLIAFSVLFGLACARPDEKYTTKYDNIDLDEVLKSERLLNNYFNCLMDVGNCSPDGAELKKLLPDALQHECSKCSEAQKKGSKKIVRFLIEHKREWFNQLEEKYDKDGAYRKKYKEDLEQEGIML